MQKLLVLSCMCVVTVLGYPEQGLWQLYTSPKHEYVGVRKSLFKEARINIKVMCDPDPAADQRTNITIAWMLRKTPCYNEYNFEKDDAHDGLYRVYYNNPSVQQFSDGNDTKYNSAFVMTKPETFACDHTIVLNEVDLSRMIVKTEAGKDEEHTQTTTAAGDMSELSGLSDKIGQEGQLQTKHPVAVVPSDGLYMLVVHTQPQPLNANYTATIFVEMRSDYGYLSAADWPLLGFYAVMCVVYLVYGVAWLVVSALRWRELLRVQYWIGAVIFLGMLETAVFTAEYSSINQQGTSVSGLIVLAELVSCAKRTLARMLVIIVSLGFGIVKPRLGVVQHRVVGVGLVYFILASVEGCMRALEPSVSSRRKMLMASLPLSLLESAICFWIFTALVETTRTLRLRRNLVKLSLYRHFTNTMAFAVLASVIFMLWSMKSHIYVSCVTDWKELWVDSAYWHVLFALVLLVIMILWRPSNNNQRFAFTPLLDDGSDADDEEEVKELMGDISDTLLQRNKRNSSSSPRESRSVEDDLKWVEENIPSSLADSAFPLMDSEEEIVTSKFEVSKMQ